MPKDIAGVLREFGSGELHSGSSSGPVVKSRKQAIAIGLSEQRQMGKKGHPIRNLKHFAHPKKGRG